MSVILNEDRHKPNRLHCREELAKKDQIKLLSTIIVTKMAGAWVIVCAEIAQSSFSLLD